MFKKMGLERTPMNFIPSLSVWDILIIIMFEDVKLTGLIVDIAVVLT